MTDLAKLPPDLWPNWLQRKEAAAILRVSVRTIERRFKSGAIRPTRTGGRTLIERAELLRHIDGGAR